MKIDGACHCGAIRFEAEIDPERVLICHCSDCQILSGSAFRTVVVASESKFRLVAGTPKIYIKIGGSGNKREQAFCENCGSPIYAAPVGAGPRDLGIRLGTVKQRDSLIPKKQIWCSASQQWLSDIDSIPGVDKQ